MLATETTEYHSRRPTETTEDARRARRSAAHPRAIYGICEVRITRALCLRSTACVIRARTIHCAGPNGPAAARLATETTESSATALRWSPCTHVGSVPLLYSVISVTPPLSVSFVYDRINENFGSAPRLSATGKPSSFRTMFVPCTSATIL